jgi:hypothetical protein
MEPGGKLFVSNVSKFHVSISRISLRTTFVNVSTSLK